MAIKISELTQGIANLDAVVPATNASGTLTEKLRIGDILDLASPGPQGAAGSTGPQGDQGSTGSQGPQGDQGSTGSQGPQGDQGSTGSQGPQGDQGSTGSQGPQGDAGSAGPQGDQGAQGPGGGSSTVVGLTYSETVSTDASLGDIFNLTLTGNATLSNPTNALDGKTIRWRISQDATGGHVVTLGDKFNIPSSATSPLPWSTAANKMDMLAATYDSTRDKWDVVAFVPGY